MPLFLFGISSSQVLPKENYDGSMNFPDNLARAFVPNVYLSSIPELLRVYRFYENTTPLL